MNDSDPIPTGALILRTPWRALNPAKVLGGGRTFGWRRVLRTASAPPRMPPLRRSFDGLDLTDARLAATYVVPPHTDLPTQRHDRPGGTLPP